MTKPLDGPTPMTNAKLASAIATDFVSGERITIQVVEADFAKNLERIAAEAIEALVNRCAYCAEGRRTFKRDGGFWHPIARGGELGDSAPCNLTANERAALSRIKAAGWTAQEQERD